MIETISKLSQLMDKLEAAHIFFKLERNRPVMTIAVAVPGQIWEIDILEDGEVAVEIFKSDGHMFDETKLQQLIEEHRD